MLSSYIFSCLKISLLLTSPLLCSSFTSLGLASSITLLFPQNTTNNGKEGLSLGKRKKRLRAEVASNTQVQNVYIKNVERQEIG